MDKAVVALILMAICGGFVAGYWGLCWLYETAIHAVKRLRRHR
jgi:hypothetical protein